MPGVDQYHMQYPVSLVVHAPAKHRLEPLMDVFLLVPLWPAPHASFHPRHHPHTALFHLHTPPPFKYPYPPTPTQVGVRGVVSCTWVWPLSPGPTSSPWRPRCSGARGHTPWCCRWCKVRRG